MAISHPTSFRLTIRNFRGLRHVVWRPAGVCALVGPNGSGKTTLLEALDLLRDALSSGLARALENRGGLAAVRFFGAAADDEIEFDINVDHRRWILRPAHVDGAGFRSWEKFSHVDKVIFTRERGDDTFAVPDAPKKYTAGDTLALDAAVNNDFIDQDALAPVLALLRDFRAYGPYDVPSLRRSGSEMTSNRRLERAGRNVFSVLRGWRDRRIDRHRIDFVMTSLAAAFPDFFEDLDFETVAQIVTAQMKLRGFDELMPMRLAPDGWFVALLHLAAVASTDPGGVISIDEPENALHPFAIRRLIEAFRDWSGRHGVTVLLATHSPVLLDTFKEQPERVFVMQPGKTPNPVALDQLKGRDWLAHFAIGDLYAHCEYGAPPDSDPRPEDGVA